MRLLVWCLLVSGCASRVLQDPGVNPPTWPPKVDCFGVTCSGEDSCCFVQSADGPAQATCADELDGGPAYCTNGSQDIMCRSNRDCRPDSACCVLLGARPTTLCGSYTEMSDAGTFTWPWCEVYVCANDSDCYHSWRQEHCVPLTANGVTLPFGACE